MVAMSSIAKPSKQTSRLPSFLGTRRAGATDLVSGATTHRRSFRLLQNASVFQLDELVQIKILEAMALSQRNELRRNALHLRADDFVHIGLEPGSLQALDVVGVDALHLQGDPLVLVGVDTR